MTSKIALHINSADRVSTTQPTTDFTIDLSSITELINIKKISLSSIEFPNTIYNINSTNNVLKIRFILDSTTQNVQLRNNECFVTIPQANYTIENLLTYINSEVNAKLAFWNTSTLYIQSYAYQFAANSFSATYNSTTGRIQMRLFGGDYSDASWTMALNDTKLARQLGYLDPVVGQYKILSPSSLVDIRIPPILYLRLGNIFSGFSYQKGRPSNILAKIYNNVPFLTTNFYKAPDLNLDTFQLSTPLNELRVQITDEDGEVFYNGNFNWSMTLICDME